MINKMEDGKLSILATLVGALNPNDQANNVFIMAQEILVKNASLIEAIKAKEALKAARDLDQDQEQSSSEIEQEKEDMIDIASKIKELNDNLSEVVNIYQCVAAKGNLKDREKDKDKDGAKDKH